MTKSLPTEVEQTLMILGGKTGPCYVCFEPGWEAWHKHCETWRDQDTHTICPEHFNQDNEDDQSDFWFWGEDPRKRGESVQR